MKLHHREFGTPGRPVLVALHGFLGTGENWSELAERIGERFHILAPDLPGHGRTISRPADFAQAAEWLEEWARRLKLATAHLLGYSMGARLALCWVLTHPARWRSVILESGSPGIQGSAAQAERASLDDARARGLLKNGLSDFLDEWQAQPLFESQHALPPLRRAKLRALRERSAPSASPDGLAWAISALSPGRQESYWPLLHHLALPVHLVVGERDEKFRGIAAQMRERIPGAATHVVDGCGHCVHFEKPDQYAALIDTLLSERQEAGEMAC